MTAGGPRFDTEGVAFSEGTDAAAAEADLARLSRRWALTSTRDGLEATFKFKTFAKSWVREASSP